MRAIAFGRIFAAFVFSGLVFTCAFAEEKPTGVLRDLAKADARELAKMRPSSLAMEKAGRFYNGEAPIPPQCYTKIEGKYNPCYMCHQNNSDQTRPNFMQDGDLQQAYDFSDAGLFNHYTNLFVDRSAEVAAISDEAILGWIGEDNYSALASYLKERNWKGYLPDLSDYQEGAGAFDENGFARDGSGWVAFNYKPLPSTFWPSNGSTDDVLIRLPEHFRQDGKGKFSRDVYMANLGLLEIAFQDLDETTLHEIDENAVGVDLDGDGRLARTGRIKKRDHYVGMAGKLQLQKMTYPEGTEFLHSVRYVGIGKEDEIHVARRMKELRYMRKTRALSLSQLRSRYGNEHQEKLDGNLPRYVDLGDKGMDNGFGWTLLGFIEAKDGSLRPQTHEEQLFCRGCHASVGGNIDQTWAFPRKVTGAGGWGYINLVGMKDAPSVVGGKGEILEYFERAGGGDEFRSNVEMLEKFFNKDGSVRLEAVEGKSVYDLIAPSRERALQLNKAYRVLVDEQSFLFGRDATVKPPANVYHRIESATAPTLPRDKRYPNDIRLKW